MNRWAKQQGFTIVELLIVIVIIGILAAITVVAYNGIQNRANNTKTQQAVAAYAKAMILYGQDKGVYPDPAFYTCLGQEYTESTKCDTAATLANTATLTAALRPYMNGSLPNPAMTDVNGRRGAFYHSNATTYYIFFMQAGTNTCPVISGTTRELGDTVVAGGIWCRASLPVLV
jgi:prepilin-type N-terminal cleavage/methylation domain-containing protein